MNDMQMLADIAGMTAELIESGKLVRVVRCKDCKHRNTIFCFKDEQGFGTDDDWFCADGEREET